MREGQEEAAIVFGPFRLLPAAKQLWRNGTRVEIRPMPLAVLIYLAQHPEQVVSGEELLKVVWAGTYVSHTVIRVCVREIRQALADEVANPHYLETIGRQGYRFIGYRQEQSSVARDQGSALSQQTSVTVLWSQAGNFVGREKELVRLHEWAAQAQRGQRRLILVSGEAGIGKSTLVNQFVSQVRAQTNMWVSLGQCAETYGRGEAYLPILEALGRLGREQGTARLTAVLHQHAPTWLMQLPALLTVAERETLQRHVAGATPERMLRELSEALEVLTADQLGILILDDLQWSDAATLAWVAAWARRPEPARLLLVGTYRPTDVVVHKHPLRGLVQELRAHGLCREMRLELLTEAEVAEYVRLRLADSPAVTALATHVYQRTDGNPLFLVNSLDALIQKRVVVEEAGQWRLRGDLASFESYIPNDLRQLITRQLEVLPAEEQRVLEVASVVGLIFTAAKVAAGCKQEEEVIEALCEHLARQGQFIEAREFAEWPDGTVSAGYSFRHALYRYVLYERLGRLQRMRLHQLLGERLEVAYRGQEAAVAGRLAAHFAQGRQYEKAVRYHQLAAEEALRRRGYEEVRQHCSQGLMLLEHLPATTGRARQELALLVTLGTALAVTKSYAMDAVREHLQRAHALSQEVSDPATLVPVLISLGRLCITNSDRTVAEGLMERERLLLEDTQDPTVAIQLSTQLCTLETLAGLHARAEAHRARVVELYDRAEHARLLLTFGGDPLVFVAAFSSLGLWLSGQPDGACRHLEQGLTCAEALGHPFSLANILVGGVLVALCRGELDGAQQLVQRLVTLSHEQGLALYRAAGVTLQGCLAVQQWKAAEGTVTITDGLVQYRGMNAQIYVPFFLSLLATGYWQQGRIEEGLQALTEALQLTETNLEVFWQAELHRLKGELVLERSRVRRLAPSAKKSAKFKAQRSTPKVDVPRSAFRNPQMEAEACFHQAIEVARRQGAKALELRATMSLARLWQQQEKRGEAHQMLSTLYHFFTEGWGTKDLQDAKALLTELS
jgi:DNA-binding winged helix-turn-helix (wHTH) protein/predicted ATPase